MTTRHITIGPFRLTLKYRDAYSLLHGFRAALRHAGAPVDPERIPPRWELRGAAADGRWPTGFGRPTDYWITIWKTDAVGSHVCLQPRPAGWRVEYDPENSWMGGDTLARQLAFDTAVEVAVDAMERLNEGANRTDIRLDYRDWGDSV